MARLIWLAWRTFWVGLGACLVLVGQSMLAADAQRSVEPARLLGPAPHAIPAAGLLPRS